MKLVNNFLLLARDVTVDSTDQMMSIIKIIDIINGNIETKSKKGEKPDEVIIPVKFSLVSSWSFDKKLEESKTIRLKVNFADHNEKDFGGPEQDIQLPKDTQRFNLNFGIDGLRASESGVYTVTAQIFNGANRLIASATYPFDVKLEWRHVEDED